MAIDVGSGATISFGTSTFEGKILSFSVSGPTRPSVDTTDLTSAARTFIPGDIIDYGTIEVTYLVDTQLPSTEVPSFSAAAETITVTFEASGAGTVGGNFTGSGFITDGPTYDIGIDEVVSASITIKCTAAWTFTAGS